MRKWILLCLMAACATARPPAKPLRLDRVVLYQNGVGYFERQGHVADGRLRFRLGAHELDDVLKTLTVIDTGGGRAVAAARLPAAGDEGAPMDLDVWLSRPSADLLVAYTVPTPTWKVAYRLVLGDDGHGLLQAWGMVANASEEDWTDVELTLATGAPLSYVVDLHTPEFVARPDATGRMVTPTATSVVRSERALAGDRDHDGLADVDDRCPDGCEDLDGFEDTDGCPDVDNDQDRIPDAEDACPAEPETWNGRDDDDGCPDRGMVVVRSSNIEILDRIYFTAGSDELPANAGPVVDAIAAVLAGNPDLTRVEVSGHAADDEEDPWGLSARRAAAVRAALVARGVAAERLALSPAGASIPIDARETPEARGRNRRVEFRVLGRAGDATAGRVTAEAVEASAPPTTPQTDVAGSVRYVVADRVTVPRGAAVMVSVLNERVVAEDVHLFRPDAGAAGSDSHPFRAVRVEGGRLALEPGPIAVFARGAFVGDGVLDRLHVGEAAFVPYALDGATAVRVTRGDAGRPLRIVAVARGVLTVEDWAIRSTTYEVEAGADAPARLYVRHTRAPGYEPVALPPATESTGDGFLVPLALAPGRTTTFVLEERQPRRRQLTLVDASSRDLAAYVEIAGADLPPEVAAALRVVVDKRTDLARLDGEIASLEEELTILAERARELRANLAAIQKTKGAEALRRQLVDQLAANTARADAVARALAARHADLAAARHVLDDAIRELQWG